MTTVVIMAGGRGLRLHPLTEHTPKPLLRVGAHPIIRQVVDGFVRQGLTDIILSLGYKAGLIREYFGNGEDAGARIRYLIEDAPQGTAGALRTLPADVDFPIIVQNADVLTHLDYHDFLWEHERGGNLATQALALHQYQVPFGVAALSREGTTVLSIAEKPIITWQVGAGIYVLDRAALDYLPADGPADMPEVLGRVGDVTAYPLEDYWCDVGTFESLDRARAAAGHEE